MAVGEGDPIQIEKFVPQWPSILDIVVARIRERSKAGDLVIIGARDPFYSSNSNVAKGIGIYTAPRIPIYEPKELTAFMERLARGIDGIEMTPTSLLEDPVSRRYAMRLGWLSFTEPIGRKTEVKELIGSPNLFAELGIGSPKNEVTITSSVTEVTTILHVYPHIRFAEAALGRLEPDLEYGLIRWEWLDRLIQGDDPFQKPPERSGLRRFFPFVN